MEHQGESIRKTFQYKLKPTPEQEQALEAVLWRCRTLCTVAIEQRSIWWERGKDQSATYYQQKAEDPRVANLMRSHRLANSISQKHQ